MLLSALIIPVLSYALQTYPRIFNRYFGVDVWTRLLEIDHVKNSGHKIPGKISRGFIIDGYFDYPIIFPWIFSFIPKKKLLLIQGFVSPFFDALQNIMVFFIALNLTGSIEISLLSQVIYALTPMIVVENSYLTPRSFGYLNFTLAFYPLILFQITYNFYFLFFSLFFSTILYLSHRFALQSFLFICLFFALANNNFYYIVVPFIAFLLAIILTKGYYLRVAKGHLANIYFWVLNYKYRFAHQVYGLSSKKKSDWVGKIYFLLSQFSPIFLLITNVWTISAFLYFILMINGNFSGNNPLLYHMSIWVIYFYIFGAIVLRVKRLIPIGEGQRYLEMATVPASILSAYLLIYFYNIYRMPTILIGSFLILGNLFLILFVQIKGILLDKNRSLTNGLIDTFNFINTLPGKPRLMCIPHQITTMTVYHTKADVLVNADNPGLMKIADFYPVLKKGIPALKKEYKLDYLILRESFTKITDLNIKKPKIVFSSNDVLVVKL